MSILLAKRYATGFFEASSKEADFDGGENSYQELKNLDNTIKNKIPKMKSFLASPKIPFSEKRKALENLCAGCALSSLTKNFCLLLLKNKRLFLLNTIVKELETITLKKQGKIKALVSSVLPLTEDEKNVLMTFLKKRFDKKITMEFSLDESLIGGIKIHAGFEVLDSSIKKQLERLQIKLLTDPH